MLFSTVYPGTGHTGFVFPSRLPIGHIVKGEVPHWPAQRSGSAQVPDRGGARDVRVHRSTVGRRRHASAQRNP